MPLYDYECDACSCQFTLLLSHAERDQPVECTACASTNNRRMMSTFAVRSTSRFSPRSSAEQLAGPGVQGGSGTASVSVLGHSH